MTFCMVAKGRDLKLVSAVVNQGIDARLEAFTRSSFKLLYDDGPGYVIPRLECEIVDAEMSILLRRLCEMDDNGDDEAGYLAEDIAEVHYGEET